MYNFMCVYLQFYMRVFCACVPNIFLFPTVITSSFKGATIIFVLFLSLSKTLKYLSKLKLSLALLLLLVLAYAGTCFCQYCYCLPARGSGHTSADAGLTQTCLCIAGFSVISGQPFLPVIWAGADVDTSVNPICSANS